MSTVSDSDFWDVTRIVSQSHGPLQHHMFFISKNLTDEDLDVRGGHVAQLFFSKAQIIYLEFASPFVDDPGSWARGLSSELLAFAVELHCHHAAAYDRRVLSFLRRLPACINAIAFCSSSFCNEFSNFELVRCCVDLDLNDDLSENLALALAH